MSKTLVVSDTSGGAGTSTDQLAGTAVEFAGKSGRVRAFFISTLTTTTAVLKGSKSGKEIIPSGCNPNVVGPITAQAGDANAFVFDGFVDPEERLQLDVTRIGTETWSIGVRID